MIGEYFTGFCLLGAVVALLQGQVLTALVAVFFLGLLLWRWRRRFA